MNEMTSNRENEDNDSLMDAPELAQSICIAQKVRKEYSDNILVYNSPHSINWGQSLLKNFAFSSADLVREWVEYLF